MALIIGHSQVKYFSNYVQDRSTKCLCFSGCKVEKFTDISCGGGYAIPTVSVSMFYLFVLRFYGPVNPMGSCRARSVYLTTRLLGRLSPLSG